MKYIKAIAVAAGLACAAATSQANIILNYSATDDSVINFTAGGFTFVNIVNAALPTFDITSTSGSSANHDSVGFLGFITGGPFVIGTINGSGTQASVSGTGALTISDGIKNLTATVIWNTIGQAGVGNVLNLNGQINLTSISYS